MSKDINAPEECGAKGHRRSVTDAQWSGLKADNPPETSKIVNGT